MLKLIKNNKSYFEFEFENAGLPNQGFYEIKMVFEKKINLPDFYTIFESKNDHIISEKNKILLLSYAFDFDKFENFNIFFSPSFF
jgi:tmRNA-binding protein